MAQVPVTDISYIADGITVVYDFEFPYLSETEVFVSLNGVNVPFAWLAGSTHSIQLVSPPISGTVVRIYRSTLAYNPRHRFDQGVPFLPRYVDENNTQLLYAVQEAIGSTAGTAAEALLAARRAEATADAALTLVNEATINSAAQLRADLLSHGLQLLPEASGWVNTVAELIAIPLVEAGAVYQTLGYHRARDGGGNLYQADLTDTTSESDGGSVLVGADGIRWKMVELGIRNVLQFGARYGTTDAVTARANTVAFRNACRSTKVLWDAQVVLGRSVTVYVPDGDYNLSNGFTVPHGCQLKGGGIGTARLRILAVTADSAFKLPLVSLGQMILPDGTLTPSTGAYVIHPPPGIDALYLNPQNSNTALSVEGVPGYRVGDLWVQANIGLRLVGTGDGTFGSIMVEATSGTGIYLQGNQNLVFASVYTFDNAQGIQIASNNNNVRFLNSQLNYSRLFGVEFTEGATGNRGISFGGVVINQNAQHAGFGGGVVLRGGDADISIDTLECVNANAEALYAAGSSVVHVTQLKLRQRRNNDLYTQGTTQGGATAVGNSRISIGSVDATGLRKSPFTVRGTSRITVRGGSARDFVAAVPIFDISGATAGASVEVTGMTGAANDAVACPLFVPVPDVDFVHNVRNAFPWVTEGGRRAMRIPFTQGGDCFNITVKANPNPSGNGNYRRVTRLTVLHETVFTSALVNTYTANAIAGAAGTVPVIAYTLDYNTVGAGNSVPWASSGYIVLSIPLTYTQFRADVSNAA